MLRPQAAGSFQVIPPALRALPRQGAHKVQVQVFKTRLPGLVKDPDRILRPVDPAKQGQFFVVKGLDAYGKAVDAQLSEGLQLLKVRRSRIDLHADLRVPVNGKF